MNRTYKTVFNRRRIWQAIAEALPVASNVGGTLRIATGLTVALASPSLWACVGWGGNVLVSGGSVQNEAAGFSLDCGDSATVTGLNSQWNVQGNLAVGYTAGTSTLDVLDGGLVSNSGFGFIGRDAGGTGTVTVTGNNSTWTSASNLYIGYSGTGALNILGRGTVNSGLSIIGHLAGSSGMVTVDGNGSTWTNGFLAVGNGGAGTLNIQNGATVNSAYSHIGASPGGNGTVTVDGQGSTWTNSANLNIGFNDEGSLSIQNGGKVKASEVWMGGAMAAGGTLNLSGTSNARGVLETGFVLQVPSSTNAINWSGGILRATRNEANFLRNFTPGIIDIQSGGAFIDTNGFNVGVTGYGVLGGVGGLTKLGTGTLTLTDANTYSGTTTVSAGTLVLSGAGALASTGSLSIAGGATFDIGTASGARTIGALSGAGDIALGANMLTAGSSANTTFSGGISGTGGLIKQGSGNLVLSGVNTYTGGTTVNAGTLSVNGAIVGNVTVNSGGALGGSGAIENVTFGAGGILAPGNSIGTLTVNGDLTFGAGSIYRVEVDAAGRSDKTVVNGNVTLAGTVDVRAGAGNYAANTSYTILSHTGSRTGVFDSVTSNLAFLTPTLAYGANSVKLDLARNNVGFASVAETRNQRETAGGVEALGSSTVYDAVAGLSAEQARTAFDTMSGTQHAAASQVAMNAGRSFSGALMNRAAFAGGRFGGVSSLRYASLDLSGVSSWQGLFASPHQLGRTPTLDTAASPSAISRFNAASGTAPDTGVWFQVLGGKGDVKGDGNGSGSDYSSTGFLAGYDTMLNQDWLMGVAVGYGKTQWDADVPATGNVDTPYAALYGRYTSGPWQIRLNGGFADNRFDTTRTITLGASSSQARSKHSGKEWSGAAEAEYAWTKASGWEVKPLAGIRYAYLDEEGFTESGSPAALKIRGRSTQQANLGVGSRFIRAFDNDNGALELRAMVTHLAGDNDAPVTASFVGSTSTFNVDGTPLKRTALVVGAGFSHQLANKLSAFADLGYEARGSGQSNAVAAIGLQYRW